MLNFFRRSFTATTQQVLLFAGLLFATEQKAQTLVYKDVASIFYSRCTSCHHTGAHDYPFMNYTQTEMMKASIQNALVTDRMPPWSADTSYTRFMHERIITAGEKQKVLSWIASGAQKGDTTLAPPPPHYSSRYQLNGEADLTISIGKFTSTSVGTDKYYCFSIPSGLTSNRIIRAFEVVPGNKSIVHHAVITADTTGQYTSDLSGSCYNIPGNLGIGTYAPGAKATVFPSSGQLKAGIHLNAGSKIIIQLHYPAGSAGQVDSTKVRFFFYPELESDVRRIYSATPLQNWSMAIPANSVVPYSAYYPSPNYGIPAPVSVFGVMPHSHLLCESIINYAYDPNVDTVKLVRISHWDFEWQDYFIFKKLVKIPAGHRLFAKHVFDNTLNNPHNPNNPPKTVYAGTGTNDEMLFDGMLYLNYEPGDELIDVEAIVSNDPLLGIGDRSIENFGAAVKAYPNPFSAQVAISGVFSKALQSRLFITDIAGRVVLAQDLAKTKEFSFTWDGSDAQKNKVAPGIYFYSVRTEEGSYAGRLIRK